MNRTIATMILAATMATGCATDPMIDGSDPTLETMEGTNGSPGTNGLLVTEFQALSLDLIGLMREPLFMNVPETVLNPDVTSFLMTAHGPKVFDYAIRCALSGSKSFTRFGKTYTGGGIVTTTTQWTQHELNDAAKEDLLACVVAHLNPLEGGSVPIFLSGPSIHPGLSSAGYPVYEAKWTAELTEVGVKYHVWPLFPVPAMCAANPYDALAKRVCGQDPVACFLELHQNAAQCIPTGNVGDDGRFNCLGRPAIMTRLENVSYLGQLYPDCFPPPT